MPQHFIEINPIFDINTLNNTLNAKTIELEDLRRRDWTSIEKRNNDKRKDVEMLKSQKDKMTQEYNDLQKLYESL